MNIITFLKKSITGELSAEAQTDFLKANLDITPSELASVVRFLQKQITGSPRLENAIDVCGTGGSGLPRINTSTISAFILSSSFGVGIAKHGNRAVSGRFGSFNLLESLGIHFTENVREIEKKYEKENLALLFAPFFHPVMKHFAEVRKKIGKPTFFNLLGPLLNPAFPKRQIIGTTFKNTMYLIAETCRLLGKEKVYVVCGEDGLDEVTLTGPTFITELSYGNIKSYTITPADFGISKARFSEIQGGNGKFNTQIARDILGGVCTSRHRDLVLVNVALALKLTDTVQTLKEGYDTALRTIDTPSILQKIIEHKKMEIQKRKVKNPIRNVFPSTRDFTAAIKSDGLSLIAEVKKVSPSEGTICKKRFFPVQIVKRYERSGVNAISILCDKKFFHGNLKHLKNVSENTLQTPLLCKDFIIDEYQIYEARKNGADAILLIASIVTEEQIRRFLEIAESLKMAVICEVHNFNELEKVLKTPAKIIGINNRDLHTFKTDISTTLELVNHIPAEKLVISESGFSSKEDVDKVRGKVDAILVGTSLMKGAKISLFLNRIVNFSRVKEGMHMTKKYKLVSREYHPEDTLVTINKDIVFGGRKPVIIAGPCAIESKKQLLEIAKAVKKLGANMLRGGAYKPRTSPYSFQGMGEEALKMMHDVGKEVGIPIVSEVVSIADLDVFQRYVDMIQIGSRNMHNFDLLQRVAALGKPILLKRGMSATMEEFLLAAEYIVNKGNPNVVLCERGIRTFETSSRNILDLNTLALIQQESHLPIIADPSHSAGRYDLVSPLAKAALSAGAHGLIIEVHNHPKEALSDGEQSLNFNTFKSLMQTI